MQAGDVAALLPYLTPVERKEFNALLATIPSPLWTPLAGPQTQAFVSRADITGFGGAAGGGKTDLACGLALTEHEVTAIFRENGTELTGIQDRLTQLIGSRDSFGGKDNMWRLTTPDGKKRQIELGSFPNPDDEKKYQGRPHDLIIYDEAANMREAAVRFLMGWNRNAQNPNQRCRVLLTFNPPTTAEGRWIIAFFAPWLDKKHPNPAKPGELRYFATVAGRDIEVEDTRPFVLKDDERVYDFKPADYPDETDIIVPLSRTFIPSRVTDNPYLMGTSYVKTLQGLPEPLRSQMLKGDFLAGVEDDQWQLIPTAWVEAAQARWVDYYPKPPMSSMGVDVARGGRDNTVIARRHGMWFDKALTWTGPQLPDGPSVAGQCVGNVRDGSAIHIDIIGIGASPYDFLNTNGQHVIGVNVSEKATALDRTGRLRFMNLRSQLWWQMREALDPDTNTGIMLPPDSRLLADLCAPTWGMSAACVKVESREDIHKRIGRSPDWASAYILALMDTPPIDVVRRHSRSGSHNPLAGVQGRDYGGHDPLANL